MTRAHFPSIVGLRLCAFGAQPPSEKKTHSLIVPAAQKKPLLQIERERRQCEWIAQHCFTKCNANFLSFRKMLLIAYSLTLIFGSLR